jgi:manganese/iron transport system ATP-binding protein/manganese/zinc/iron transport system ATP- binding protein
VIPLEVTGVSKHFGGLAALRDVSLALGPGERRALIGPNGAGKTTLFKAVLGLIPPQRGDILLHEAPALGQRAMMGYLPQLEEVNREFPVSVADVVMMGRYPRIGWGRRPGSEDFVAVRQALERVDLLAQARTRIGRLSGGQQQRAFLARVLAQDPHLFLLDEPVSGVDATTQHAIFALLEDLRDRGKTVIVATHDLNCVIERFDQVLCLNRWLIAYGPPREVFREDILDRTYGHHLMIVRVGDRRIVVADEHRT